jgi:hypothetical protein
VRERGAKEGRGSCPVAWLHASSLLSCNKKAKGGGPAPEEGVKKQERKRDAVRLIAINCSESDQEKAL